MGAEAYSYSHESRVNVFSSESIAKEDADQSKKVIEQSTPQATPVKKPASSPKRTKFYSFDLLKNEQANKAEDFLIRPQGSSLSDQQIKAFLHNNQLHHISIKEPEINNTKTTMESSSQISEPSIDETTIPTPAQKQKIPPQEEVTALGNIPKLFTKANTEAKEVSSITKTEVKPVNLNPSKKPKPEPDQIPWIEQEIPTKPKQSNSNLKKRFQTFIQRLTLYTALISSICILFIYWPNISDFFTNQYQQISNSQQTYHESVNSYSSNTAGEIFPEISINAPITAPQPEELAQIHITAANQVNEYQIDRMARGLRVSLINNQINGFSLLNQHSLVNNLSINNGSLIISANINDEITIDDQANANELRISLISNPKR